MNGTARRVALYTRISTDETNQPYSLGAQRVRMEAHVAVQPGWQIVAHYEDLASGKSLDRPGLATARSAASAGLYDLLLVFRVDRLSRNLGQLAVLIEELEGAGVAFQSLSEPFDTTTPAGRMMLQMLGVFAEFERASIIERIGAGMERKARRGEWTVGSYPYGYHRGPGGPGLTPDPGAARVVRDVFDRYVTHRQGSGAIAEWLNARALRTTGVVVGHGRQSSTCSPTGSTAARYRSAGFGIPGSTRRWLRRNCLRPPNGCASAAPTRPLSAAPTAVRSCSADCA